MITFLEKQHLEKSLIMEGGYVLEFTNRSFEEFFREVVGIEIYSKIYDYESGSKANRMRAFWQKASKTQLINLLQGLKEGWSLFANSDIPKSTEDLLTKILDRLSRESDKEKQDKISHSTFSNIKFSVALSFPGTQRDYVKRVSALLKAVLSSNKVFYDKDFQAQLARPNLDTLLQNVYHKQSDLIVVFLGADYENSDWCGLEWRAIRDIIKQKKSSQIMLVRFDNTPIDGIYEIDGYLDAQNYSAEEVSEMILQRVSDNQCNA